MGAPPVYRAQFMLKRLLNGGGCASTPLLPFCLKPIKSCVGHAISIVSIFTSVFVVVVISPMTRGAPFRMQLP